MPEKNFRDPDTIKKQIEDTKKVIEIHLNLLKNYPNDKVIKISLEQYQFLLNELIQELEISQQQTNKN